MREHHVREDGVRDTLTHIDPEVQRRVAAALIKDARAVSLSHPVPIFFGVVMVMISSVPSAYPRQEDPWEEDQIRDQAGSQVLAG